MSEPLHTVVVGGGAAALGLLSAAMLSPDGLEPLLSGGGLTIVDSGPRQHFGAGRLGGYLVRSDTRGRVFTESLNWLEPRPGSDIAELLARVDTDDPVPLRVAGRLLSLAGQQLLGRFEADPRITLLSGARLISLHPQGDRTSLALRVGGRRPPEQTLEASRVVLALGGRPAIPSELLALASRVHHSDTVLRTHGRRRLLADVSPTSPQVLIVGGSHSAFAVAGLLLRSPVQWPEGGITIAHRSPVRVTYPDAETARAQGISITDDDICVATGLVSRFGGLRADAAGLYERIRSGSEARVRVFPLSRQEGELAELAGPGTPVVAATGYESRAGGLLAGGESHWDGLGRLRDTHDEVVPGVYGLGLGTHRPRGPETGGEPAFTGSIDGVWFYQNVVAPALLRLLDA